jgi:hypothetical protein
MALGKEEIEERFGFHKATIEGENATLPRHKDVRIKFREFAEWLDIMVTDGRAKSVMFTELETCSMWAHKAIAEEAPLIGEEAEYNLNEAEHLLDSENKELMDKIRARRRAAGEPIDG